MNFWGERSPHMNNTDGAGVTSRHPSARAAAGSSTNFTNHSEMIPEPGCALIRPDRPPGRCGLALSTDLIGPISGLESPKRSAANELSDSIERARPHQMLHSIGTYAALHRRCDGPPLRERHRMRVLHRLRRQLFGLRGPE